MWADYDQSMNTAALLSLDRWVLFLGWTRTIIFSVTTDRHILQMLNPQLPTLLIYRVLSSCRSSSPKKTKNVNLWAFIVKCLISRQRFQKKITHTFCHVSRRARLHHSQIFITHLYFSSTCKRSECIWIFCLLQVFVQDIMTCLAKSSNCNVC